MAPGLEASGKGGGTGGGGGGAIMSAVEAATAPFGKFKLGVPLAGGGAWAGGPGGCKSKLTG